MVQTIDILTYTFICHQCNETMITYIDREKYQMLIDRQLSIDEIFENFPISYRQMIKIGYCNECQKQIFDIQDSEYCIRQCEEGVIYDKLYDIMFDLYTEFNRN